MKINQVVSKLRTGTPTILGSEDFYKFSILLPLLEINDEIHILFEVRSQQLRRQPGEICFPGGKVDLSDKTYLHTAIRETSEELGIEEQSIEHVSPLDYIVSPFGMMIFPFVGVISNPGLISPNPSEVEEVFTVPLSYLLQTEPDTYQIEFKLQPEQNFPYELIVGGENYRWQVRRMDEHFYFYEDKVIWGLTARILKHFIERVKADEEIKRKG